MTSIDTERKKLRIVALAAIKALLDRVKETSGGGTFSMFDRMDQITKRVKLRDKGPSLPGQLPIRSGGLAEEQEREVQVRNFEKTLWDAYGLTGIIVPDELLKRCQHLLRDAQVHDPPLALELEEELRFLDLFHQYRKACSLSFAQAYPAEIWRSSRRVEPREEMRSKGPRFWAVIIGNDRYERAPLSGCINDAHLVMRFITTYLGVRRDHIRLLEDADRNTIIEAFYDLRDNKDIQYKDNILIHYSGHGSSYPAKGFFTSSASQAGSIEAICPVDRGGVPDISERELNSILSEIKAAKGPNITVILDCCHSGGVLRTLDNQAVRFIPPLLDKRETRKAFEDRHPYGNPASPAVTSERWEGDNSSHVQGKEALRKMFEAADRHPRRNPNFPTLAYEHWEADISSFVLLAACQDFQVAEEFNITPGEEPDYLPTRGMKLEPYGLGSLTRHSPRFGRFTWALVKILESDRGINATYESLITSIGRLGNLQVPVVVGSRKDSSLWFEDMPSHS